MRAAEAKISSHRPGSWLLARVGVVVLAVLSVWLLNLPGPLPAHRYWLPGLVHTLGAAVALSACALAAALALLQRRFESTFPLALVLIFGTIAYGVATAHPFDPLVGLGRPEGLRWGIVWACIALAGSAWARFSVSFPQPLERAHITSKVQQYVHARPEILSARTRKIVEKSARLELSWINSLLRLRLPAGLRRPLEAYHKRDPLQDEVPHAPFGLPWNAWRFGIPLAAVALITSSLGAPSLAQATASFALLPIGYGTHLFVIGYGGSTVEARRKLLWLWEGLQLAHLFPALVIALTWTGGATASLLNLVGAGEHFMLMEGAVKLFPLSFAVGAFCFVACLAMATFKDGALDPALAVQRTTLYGFLGLILTGLFVVVEELASAIVVKQLNLPDRSGAVLAGIVAALGFGPLRNWVEERTSRLMDHLLPVTALAGGARNERVIVFSDLTNYTGDAAEDERSASTLASLLHKEARKAAETRQGRVVKTVGDAVLLEFTTAAAAVHACMTLHEKFPSACELLDLPKIPLRTGIHLGEVVQAPDGDLIGNAVSLASRLEQTASPGEIVLSQAVAEELRGTAGVRISPMGERQLKNFPDPVSCYRLEASGSTRLDLQLRPPPS